MFLPLLLFHASLTIDVREIAQRRRADSDPGNPCRLRRRAAIGFSLSFVGVPLVVALLLGTIVATTDPAAVVAIFRDLGAPPRLTRLLEGEALLNDAAAIVLFGFLVDLLTGDAHASLAAGGLHFVEAFFRRPAARRRSPGGCSA